MAITNLSDFVIYDEQFQGGYLEKLAINDEVFNEASGGCLRLISEDWLGSYKQQTFFKTLGTSVISRQDTTSNSAVTPHKLTHGEHVTVKLFRKAEPVKTTFNAFDEIGKDAMVEGSYLIGQAFGDAMSKEMLNTTLKALRVAIAAQSTNYLDATARTPANASHVNILDALAKMGDASARIRTLVMHSRQWFDLMKQSITDGFEVIAANDVIKSFYVPAFGLKVVVTDSPSLVSGSDYYVLGLQESAATVSRIKDVRMAIDTVLGNEQLEMITQGEYKYALGLKGFAWDTTNGGDNPDDTALATASNWDAVMTNYQDLAGVALKVLAMS